MTRDEFDQIEAGLMKEIVKRRALGGYSADATTIQFLAETLYEISRHISAKVPRPKSKSEEE
jgi:hypothetical protein